jgi:hypothetical protein
MVDENRKFGGRIFGQFFTDLILIPYQDHPDPVFLGSQKGAFDNVMRGKIPSHGIDCDLHLTFSPDGILNDLFLFHHLDDLFSLISTTVGTDMVGE